MSPRTDRYVATTAMSILFQLIVAGWLWIYMGARDVVLPFAASICLFSLCGVSLLCALDGMRRVTLGQRLFSAGLAIFPAFVLLSSLYLLIRARTS